MTSPIDGRIRSSRDGTVTALIRASSELEESGWTVESGEYSARRQRLVLTRSRRWRRRTERVEIIVIDGGTLTRPAPVSKLRPRIIQTLWRARPGESGTALLQRLQSRET